MDKKAIEKLLLENLTGSRQEAVKAKDRRLLVVAGAGSGKTEVMARRIACWVGIEGVSKDQIVAFTFTERAAEEMKFRIRSWIEKVTPAGEEVSLGQMYVGTIHGFCLLKIREFWPDDYHKKELEYQPEQGLVRYLDAEDVTKAELSVPLDASALQEATSLVAKTAHMIRNRRFGLGPGEGKGRAGRCSACDFLGFCGMKEARAGKKDGTGDW